MKNHHLKPTLRHCATTHLPMGGEVVVARFSGHPAAPILRHLRNRAPPLLFRGGASQIDPLFDDDELSRFAMSHLFLNDLQSALMYPCIE